MKDFEKALTNRVGTITPKTALVMIVCARDHAAEEGETPPWPLGPAENQAFDDWAADLAEIGMRGCEGRCRALTTRGVDDD